MNYSPVEQTNVVFTQKKYELKHDNRMSEEKMKFYLDKSICNSELDSPRLSTMNMRVTTMNMSLSSNLFEGMKISTSLARNPVPVNKFFSSNF